jgi:hypothetical protein
VGLHTQFTHTSVDDFAVLSTCIEDHDATRRDRFDRRAIGSGGVGSRSGHAASSADSGADGTRQTEEAGTDGADSDDQRADVWTGW